MWFNMEIWEKTDLVKKRGDVSTFSEIFDLNQKRFRVKKLFNDYFSSSLKEQKSYGETHGVIRVEGGNVDLAAINSIMFNYDTISFAYKETTDIDLESIYDLPNVLKEPPLGAEVFNIDIKDVKVPVSIFDFEPLTYICGGLLGDFIHQLSVVYEKYRVSGRKAILHLTDDVGDKFRFGSKKAYEDTREILALQSYIKEYKVVDKAEGRYDYNLSEWRDSGLLYRASWYTIFNSIYNVEWGTHKWLELPRFESWTNKVVVTCSQGRPPSDLEVVRRLIGDGEVIFLTQNEEEYRHFVSLVGVSVPFYVASSYMEFCTIINSCKMFIGNLSSPFALALSLHKKGILMLDHRCIDNNYMIDLPILKDLFRIV